MSDKPGWKASHFPSRSHRSHRRQAVDSTNGLPPFVSHSDRSVTGHKFPTLLTGVVQIGGWLNKLVGITVCLICLASFAKAQANQESDAKLALLIAVGHYPTLSSELQLEGPVNDVQLMRHMLEESFAFATTDIVTLSTDQANVDMRPTRANIQREFHALAQRASADAQVMVFFAGHGSQQPKLNPDRSESDGLDEIFLPSDVGKWNGEIGGVENAIVDDEIGQWLRPIEAKGAFVTLIVDACHSGSLMRSGHRKTRDVPIEQLVPKEKIQAAKALAKRANATSPASPSQTSIDSPAQPAQSVKTIAIYASLPHEQTIEDSFDSGSAKPKVHGLLTYTLCEVLNHANEPLSYRELIARVHQRYADRAIYSPVPNLGGAGEDRVALGIGNWGAGDWQRLRRHEQSLVLSAGKLSGLEVDSILEVRRSPNEKEPVLGYVRVQAADTIQSQVVPITYKGSETSIEGIPEVTYCRVVFRDPGLNKLLVAIDSGAEGKTEKSLHAIASLTKHLQTLSETPAALYALTTKDKAEWIIECASDEVTLVANTSALSPATNVAADRSALPMETLRFGPRPLAEGQEVWVEESLQKIARANNLLKIAQREQLSRKRRQCPRVDLSLEHVLPDTATPDTAIPDQVQRFRHGDKMKITIANPCPTSVDVTALVIDGRLGIEVLFPIAEEGEINRLASGETKELSELTVEADRSASEHLIVITVLGEGPINNLASLFQPGVRRGEAHSPIAALLQQAWGNGTGMRSGDTPKITRHSIQKITWQVSP